MPPPLPTVVGAVVNRSLLLAVPRGETFPVPPTKLTVAAGPRTRAARVRTDVAPVATAAGKPAVIVEWPLASVIVPTVSTDAADGLLFARKLRAPLLKVRPGLVELVKRLLTLTAVLSSCNVPPCSMAAALVPR